MLGLLALPPHHFRGAVMGTMGFKMAVSGETKAEQTPIGQNLFLSDRIVSRPRALAFVWNVHHFSGFVSEIIWSHRSLGGT